MKIDQDGIDLIEQWEGLENEAYPDPATGGEPWTIGIGHTSAAGEPEVYKGLKITTEEAHEIFRRDVVQYEDAVNRVCSGPTTQHQFNAMVSLCYNIGPGNFDGSSVERYHNEQNYPEAAESFLLWNKANGQVMQGLINRRESEKAHYETPDAGWEAWAEATPLVQYDYLIADSSQPEGGWVRVDDVTVWRRKRK